MPDAGRPLSAEGRREARRVGGLLRRLDLPIDLAVSSPALRARQTAALAAEGSGKKARSEPRLYEGPADADGYLAVLRGLPASASRVLLVGHNPALRQAAAALLGCFPEGLHLPPGALLCLQAPADDWASLEPGSCLLEWLVNPELTAAFGRRPPAAPS